MNIPRKQKRFNKKDSLFKWLNTVALQDRLPQKLYYTVNKQAIKLNLPQFHFYTRLVQLANYRTGTGNISLQFEYFGGHWRRSSIYDNTAILEKKGIIQPRVNGKRYFRPTKGGKRFFINHSVMRMVRTREEALYFKFLLFLVENRKNVLNTSVRTLIRYGFCATDAQRFAGWIRQNLTSKRLKRLCMATVWKFRKLTKRTIYWYRGNVPWAKFNAASVTNSGRFNHGLTIEKGKDRSNGPLRDAPTTASAEPATSAGHREPPDKMRSGSDAQAPEASPGSTRLPGNSRIIAVGSSIAPPGDVWNTGSRPEQQLKDLPQGEIRSMLYDNIPDKFKKHFEGLKKFF